MTPSLTKGEDVLLEEERVKSTTSDPLRLLHVSKRFKDSSAKAVDDVSFGVGSETLALLGPNGAGKTTTFNIIRKWTWSLVNEVLNRFLTPPRWWY